MYSGTKVN